jgi:endoglucanase
MIFFFTMLCCLLQAGQPGSPPGTRANMLHAPLPEQPGAGFVPGDTVCIRLNQVGFLPGDHKTALVFSSSPLRESFSLFSDTKGQAVMDLEARLSGAPPWLPFPYYYVLDFSGVMAPGDYHIRGEAGTRSKGFRISGDAYAGGQELLLEFMRQQRCGYNPFLEMECHLKDGKSFYGPMPDSSFVEVSGGWHDAGDQLKYLITASYATAHMLLAYELYPDRFADRVDDRGRPGANGIPDVLDEARWGLEWIHRLHPAPDRLVHQVGDDRDHVGWKMPDEDPSDYGWGKNSFRPVYFATGEPQGLGAYKSRATGMANLAGRSAAAMAMAARIWKEELGDPVYGRRCREAALSLYRLGREHEGFQQGNSYGAPYRYGEESWADDMEWGAAELFRVTGDSAYLEDAVRYARLAGTDTWMPCDTALHYQYYPFVNLGHFALHGLVGEAFKDTLLGYYRSGIEDCLDRAAGNPFGVGVPFLWCSNNLVTGLITQGILYGKMSGDTQYEPFLDKQRDWLFGRNPWGTSMFTGIPQGGEYPEDVHTSIRVLTGRKVAGGLVDGPVYATIYNSLLGLALTEPDEFTGVQNSFVVYHDDIGDYSTNEPTMDGTAGAILMMAHWASGAGRH